VWGYVYTGAQGETSKKVNKDTEDSENEAKIIMGYNEMRKRRLANGQVIMDGSPIGFIADYCPMCDGSSIVTYVDPEFSNFKCIQCGKTWGRPTHTVEFDMQHGIVQPDIINTIAGAYQKAASKRRVKPRKRKTIALRKRNAKTSKKR
jgi:hypothetical protein